MSPDVEAERQHLDAYYDRMLARLSPEDRQLFECDKLVYGSGAVDVIRDGAGGITVKRIDITTLTRIAIEPQKERRS
jgi:hypothetical protein